MKNLLIALALLPAFCLSLPGHAGEALTQTSQADYAKQFQVYDRTLESYEPSFFGNVWDRGGIPHLQIYLSIKYLARG